MFATSIKHAQINIPVQRVLKQKRGGGKSKHLDAIYCRTTEMQFIKIR